MFNQNIIEYIGVFSFILFTFFFCFISLFMSFILGGKSDSSSKNIPFESGAPSTGNVNLKFTIKFYLIAIFFVIFDIESMYLYAWSTCVRENGWIGFAEVSFFIFMILLSLLYLFRVRALNWIDKD
ncbi:NADH-quinone oxidoreductase subunit A [Buchnera aphidicola (Periphyllus testudinaceus)]|uniref:NADH-quinone oxidoreductase subunit A n=1 Tax=Buchnera aphidicola TaxID=9 RepID=UPI0034647E1D